MRVGMKSFGLTPVFLTTALFAGLFVLATRPARATVCPHGTVQNGFAFFTDNEGATSLGQEEIIHSDGGSTDEIHVLVELHDGTFADVGESENLVTIVPQGAGHVDDRRYIPSDADDNKTLTAYSLYKDPCDGTTHTFTCYIKVLPGTGLPG